MADYDLRRPLFIDPLVYSTYLGGSGADYGYGIAVDSSGNAYVTGYTASTNFPTMNPLQPSYGGSGDAFVAKINPAGSALVYSTYLGGSEADSRRRHRRGQLWATLTSQDYRLNRLSHNESPAAS